MSQLLGPVFPLEMRELVATYLNKYYLGVTIATMETIQLENNTIQGEVCGMNRKKRVDESFQDRPNRAIK